MQNTMMKGAALTVVLVFGGVLALNGGSHAVEPSHDASGQHPNVLLVMTDDQGWGDVYSHGNDRIDTPTMDGLAAEGVRFDRFYVEPVCAPTRAALMTGRYFLRTGVGDVTRGLETLRTDEFTIAEMLKKAGYATGLFGKWHLGSHYPHTPDGQGFDEFFGHYEGHWNNYHDPDLIRNRDTVETNGFITDVLTDAALEFIRTNRDRPFFAYVAYNAPHAPYQVPDSYFEKYTARGFEEKNAAVYGMVENIDDNLKRLLQELQRHDLSENTIVIFLTDNGPNGDRYNGGMKGHKGRVDEGGVRVPFFIRWPARIPGNRIIREQAAHIDVLPTLADLIGIQADHTKPLDGISLAPLLLHDSTTLPERTIFTHRGQAKTGLNRFPGAARTERYRLVCYDEPCELYDMLNDPSQRRNIASEQPQTARRLRGEYDAWFEDVMSEGVERPAIPVGYDAAPIVSLPATEAYFDGGVEYVYRGYAHEWLTNWQKETESIWWSVDVVEPGRYEVQLAYSTPPDVSSVRVTLDTSGDVLPAILKQADPHEPSVRLDRVPTDQRLEKDFSFYPLGAIRLKEGRQRLTLRLEEAISYGGLDVYGIRLRRID